MMYKHIECPHCGNVTQAKSISEAQKCKWCRRLFEAKITRRNKEGRKGKYDWKLIPVDFPDDSKPKIKSIDDYMHEDIYGVTNK